ncbi:hypothetical protein RHMOL_Rhmol06G0099700 [Rhododendron molle]|uniref:Uncharacterized protein n=1 Tax=Rhododendron molle TaxID=49168 RepID=A0ACC0NAY9_RHOML|nr:hypothetical protein RHMOL_Rhmol06G0099700 [Rhododendron molle]
MNALILPPHPPFQNFLIIRVDEDNAANNNWDQYASSHSTYPTSNWEVEHVNPPTDRVLVSYTLKSRNLFFNRDNDFLKVK